MHVTVRGARPQLSLRALLMLGGATLMVIVGLLAMHTFTSEPAVTALSEFPQSCSSIFPRSRG